jgi:hypothetical protein
MIMMMGHECKRGTVRGINERGREKRVLGNEKDSTSLSVYRHTHICIFYIYIYMYVYIYEFSTMKPTKQYSKKLGRKEGESGENLFKVH